MWTEILATIATIVGGLFTYLGVRYTGRQARAASAVTRAEDQAVIVSHDDVERRKDAIDGYETLSTSLLKRISDQDIRIGEIEQRQTNTDRKLYQTQRSLFSAVAYIERLLDFISAQLPEHPAVPPMPPEVREQMNHQPGGTP